MSESVEAAGRSLVSPGSGFSGIDDAVVGALNYPVVLPGRQRRQMRKVDLGDLHSRINGSVITFGACLVDDRGRVAGRHVLRSLNWSIDTRLASSIGANYAVLKPVPDGRLTVDGQFRIRLTASLLHYCDLSNGDLAFLVGVPEYNMLIVHPPVNVEEMVRGFHEEQLRRSIDVQVGGSRHER
ncbi:hypothetical protein [Saccharothrix sp. Mg75]|uniref:hypothetical protein n=1 Tax=Saccharothrix sp. Mg75 TaxID=3445357 RepID=UPI003EECCA88